MVITETRPVADRSPVPPGPPEPGRSRRSVSARLRDISPHAWITAAIAALASVLYTWSLSNNGLGNSYYAAAVRAGSVSWKAFLFGSLDPGSFTTVDKPPAALWMMDLSARILGFNSWSLLLPEAAAGVASVLVVHRLVRRWAGDLAAHLSALAFAVTPVAVLMFRLDNPDALLTLLCLLAAWATWSAVETGRTRSLVLAGALLGLAFDTKMLQAFLVLPALAGVYLVAGPPKLGRRLLQLLAGGVALLVTGGWWVALVELWPAAARPYIGSTQNNSIVSLIFGYNGLSRLFGAGAPGGGGGGGSFGGNPGFGRLWNDIVGGEIAWFIPLAAAGLVAGLWLTRRGSRRHPGRAGWLMWAGWALVCGAVFSLSKGVFHPYYVVQLAPALAVLAGAGSVALWELGRRHRPMRFALPLAVVATAAMSAVLLGRYAGYDTGLRIAVGAAAGVAAAGLWVAITSRHGRLTVAAALVAAITLLAGPAAYSSSTIAASITGSTPTAGPSGGGRGGFSGAGDPTSDTSLVGYLEAHRDGARYLAATFGSQSSEGLIIDSGQAVMTIGGFTGSDPDITLSRFVQLVDSGQVRYVVMDGGGAGAGGGPGGPGGGSTSAIQSWVQSHGRSVTVPGSSTTVYAVGTAA